MNQSAQSLERRRLREVAREYAGQGYKVRLHPGEADLPRFLSSFRPALIAYGPDENVVAEVKSKSTLSESEYLAALASAAADMPGWRLDLVVTNPKHAPVVDNGAEELDQAEVEARIKAVRELWAVHQEDAAILLAWSAIEAAMRLVAKRESIELENDQPAFVLKKLFSLGLLGREDFALFREGMRLRSLIVHGYRSPRPEREFVSRLLRRAEELLTTNAKRSPSR